MATLDPDLLPLHRQPWTLVAVAVGGGLGAAARYGFGLAVPAAADGFPTGTLLINLTGCFVLGLLIEVLHRRARPGTAVATYARPLVGSGFLGAWTTYSTFAVESDRLLVDHHWAVVAAYLAASLVGGILAAAAGIVLGARA